MVKPGKGEVLIKVHAVAINPADWHVQDTGMFIQHWLHAFGEDAAGEIVEVGEGVSSLSIGQRVTTCVLGPATGFDYSLDSINDFATFLEGPLEDPTTLGQSYTQEQESSYADSSQTVYPAGGLPSTPQLNSAPVQPTFALGERPPPREPAVGRVNKFLRPASLTARPTTRLPQENPLTTLPRPQMVPTRGLKAEPADGNSTVARQSSSLGTRATLTQEQPSRLQQYEANVRQLGAEFEALRTKLPVLEAAKVFSLVQGIEDEQKRQAAQIRDMIDMVERLGQDLTGN